MSTEQRNKPTPGRTPPAQRAKQVNTVCDAFEAAWSAGKQPRIEDYLLRLDQSLRAELLHELLVAEMDLQICAGKKPNRDQYVARFPECVELIDRAIGQIEGPAVSVNSDPFMGAMNGKTIAHYCIIDCIGAGGMGEVYRATDTKLNRMVAIKMLPESFAKDKERLARFEREARILASLNHPSIATIHGIEDSGGTKALVLELVSGKTVAKRLHRGPLPVKNALEVCKQIAEALEVAHEKGVIHRDLNPSNIKITEEGSVKVLDFGLAKEVIEAPSTLQRDSQWEQSTATRKDYSTPGVILGTYAYMSPEQATGQTVDQRTDIWSFGCVLFECLSGQRAFDGKSPRETIEAVLHKEVDWSAVPKTTPGRIRILLRRCLEKDPGARLRHIGDALLEIRDATSTTESLEGPIVEDRPEILHSSRARGSVFLVLIALAALAMGFMLGRNYVPLLSNRSKPVIRFEIFPPGDTRYPVVSPNGQYLVFGIELPRGSLLWLQSIDSTHTRPLRGTEGARNPFWSPDSQFIGFFSDGKLKKVNVSGGPPQELADAINNRSGTWNQDGVILFAPQSSGPLYQLSASGGVPKQVTELDSANQENSHRWPHFLPDGRQFVYLVRSANPDQSGIYLGALDSAEKRRLIPTYSSAWYVAPGTTALHRRPGYLLFVRAGVLLAQRFDSIRGRILDEPITVTDQAGFAKGNGLALFSVSNDGLLTYSVKQDHNRQFVWFDRSGKQLQVAGDAGLGAVRAFRLSPDETRVVFSLIDSDTVTPDIWCYDLSRRASYPLTTDPASEYRPIWSPDGKHIALASNRDGPDTDLYRMPVGSPNQWERLVDSKEVDFPSDWSLDRNILYDKRKGGSGNDIWVLPLGKTAYVWRGTKFNEQQARFSPNGRWIAYASDESGTFQVYVRSFHEPEHWWPISTNGGVDPLWRRDGEEILYLAPDGTLMAASVTEKAESLEIGTQEPLFNLFKGGLTRSGWGTPYAVSNDGQRILVSLSPDEGAASTSILVITNWFEELKTEVSAR